jgi:hypothetical protein
MNGKTIYVRRGQVFTVESLQDSVTGAGFFLVKNEEGEAICTSEISTAEGVVFTADESKRTFSVEGIEFQVYCVIKNHLRKNQVSSMQIRELARLASDELDSRIGFSPNGVSKICKSLGMRVFRKAEGVFVSLEEEDLKLAESRFRN